MKKTILISIVIIIFLGIGLIIFPIYFLADQRTFETVTISGNGYQIKGYVSEGIDPEGKWIILVHGNRKTGQDHELYRVIRNNLPLEYSVLAIDLRGFGGSTGNGINQMPMTIDRSDDLLMAENFLKQNYNIQEDQIVLIGHSFGAAQVMGDAQNHGHSLVIPIGLGDWGGLISNPSKITEYIRKFERNTGISLEPGILIEDGKQLSSQFLFSKCPNSPVWLIFASHDDAREIHYSSFKSLEEKCQSRLKWSEIARSDHTYGTERERFPEPINFLYSRFSLSLLIWRINQILSTV